MVAWPCRPPYTPSTACEDAYIKERNVQGTYWRLFNELMGFVVASIVLVFENVEEGILLADHSLPASSEFDMQLGVILDANIVTFTKSIRIEGPRTGY